MAAIDSYAHLTREGSASYEGSDPEAWRADIRANARADGLRVRTNRVTARRAVAELPDFEPSAEQKAARMESVRDLTWLKREE